MEGLFGLAHSGHPLAVARTWLFPHRHPLPVSRGPGELWGSALAQGRAAERSAPPAARSGCRDGADPVGLSRAMPCRAAVPCVPTPRASVPVRPSAVSAWLGAVAVLLCTVLSPGWAEAQPFPFRDPTLPWHRRLEDLLGRLTPAEMVLQVRAR